MNWLSNIFSGPKDTESVLEAIFSPPVPERLEGDRQGMLAADNPVRQLSDELGHWKSKVTAIIIAQNSKDFDALRRFE